MKALAPEKAARCATSASTSVCGSAHAWPHRMPSPGRMNPATSAIARRSWLLHQPGVNDVLEHHARMDPVGRTLRHEDADQFFLGVDPEAGAPEPRPHGVALGTRHPTHAVVMAHTEAQAEAIARPGGPDGGAPHADGVLRQHDLHGLLRQVTLAVELAAVEHHLREAQVVGGRADEPGASLEVALAERVVRVAVGLERR